jgi:hypothetical protein
MESTFPLSSCNIYRTPCPRNQRSLVATASQFMALSLSLLQVLMNVSSFSCLFEFLPYDLMWHVYLHLSTECTPWFSLTIELRPCGFTNGFMYPPLPSSQVGECHIWSYTQARFSSEVSPQWETSSLSFGTWERWSHLPPYRYNQRSCPIGVNFITWIRCPRLIVFPHIPTWEDAWGHP